jgi:multidrug resistance protein MdtO
MSAAARRPDVDGGDPPVAALLLQRLVAPTPGRLGSTLRVTALVLAVVLIEQTFRIPDIAISAYIILFVSRTETASTVTGALVAGIAVTIAIFATIVVFMLSLGETGLRIPLIAAATFAAMFLSRAATLGPVFFVAGFIIAYGLTFGDEVLGIALQPDTAANTPQASLPEFLLMPPEEALLHALLWLALAVVLSIGLVVIGNLLSGRDTVAVVRGELAERLDAAARFCAGEESAAPRLAGFAREGLTELLKLQHFARGRAGSAMLTQEIARLGGQLLAWQRMTGKSVRAALHPAAAFCLAAAAALRERTILSDEPPQLAASGPLRPLAELLSRTLGALRGAMAPGPPAKGGSSHGLLVPDAFSNPEYPRFALKVTLAVMLCYLGMSLADWHGIHTCMITCFFVALGTLGETIHKATLRIAGCLIGAALGIGAILMVMPLMTDIGDLLLLLFPVTFLAAWIGFGGERIGYAGWQIGLAFYLVVLQGDGPTLDMQTGRDRIVGILIGNLVIFVIFIAIWPVHAADVARASLAKAVESLGLLLEPDGAQPNVAAVFTQAIERARGVLVNDRFETQPLRGARRARPIDATVVAQVQALVLPVSVLIDLRAEPAATHLPEVARRAFAEHESALAAWFRRAASWVATGAGAEELLPGLPAPPDHDPTSMELPAPVADHVACRMAWLHVLREDVRAILDEVVARAQPALGAPAPEALHALP